MKIKLVLFDAEGVLVEFNQAIGEALERKFGITQEQQKSFWNEYPRLTAGQLTTEEFLDIVASRCKIDRSTLSVDDFSGPYVQSLTFVEGMEDLVEKLHKSGIQLALLSDTSQMIHES